MSNGSKIPGRPPIFDRFTGVRDVKLRADNPLYGKTRPITPQFEIERCEFNARHMADQQKTEAQRRFENMRREQMTAQTQKQGRSSQMIKQDRPTPQLKPSPAMAAGADRSAYLQRLALERAAQSKAQSAPIRSKEAFIALRRGERKSHAKPRER